MHYQYLSERGGSPNGLRKLPAREEAPAAGACPAPALPAPPLPWRPPAPTGGLGENIGAPRRRGGFRPNPPRGGFPPIRQWWARWVRLAPTGGFGEKIGAPRPRGGFRPNPPRGGFPPIRRWWARVGSATPFSPPLSLIGLAEFYIFLQES